jgi:hypothetical protein
MICGGRQRAHEFPPKPPAHPCELRLRHRGRDAVTRKPSALAAGGNAETALVLPLHYESQREEHR